MNNDRTMLRFAACIAWLGMLFAANAFADFPEVSPDGLHLVKRSGVAVVYVRPGASLKPYSKFAILQCTVAFKPNWREDMQTEYNTPITDGQIHQIESEVAAAFKQVFTTTLSGGGYPVVDTAGPDVVVLRPGILNLSIAAPAVNLENPGQQTFATSAGSMTLVLEFYDSVSSQLLARVIDPQTSSDYGIFTWQSGTGNVSAAEGVMKKWADTLLHYMEAAHGAQ